jgi:hypothetical protein
MSSRVHIDDPDERQQWIEGRRDRLELTREAGWGGVSWFSVAAGVFTALGAFALCVGITAAVLHPLDFSLDGLTDNDWQRLGLVTGLVSAAALLGAFSFGGYAAGRMARRAGLRHGVLVFAVGVGVLAWAAGIAGVEGAAAAIRDRLESFGAPTGASTWFGVAVVTGAAALGGMLLGAVLGGIRGERWHQRLVARALDPDIGPEADLRAEAERQRIAAAKALERARKAGVVPITEEAAAPTTRPVPARAEREPEPTEVVPGRSEAEQTEKREEEEAGASADGERDTRRKEPTPTAAGPPMPPSSWSSGP